MCFFVSFISVEVTTVNLTTIVQPPLPPIPEMNAVLPAHPVCPVAPQQIISFDHVDSQDRNLLHNQQPGSNFQRTSRLNSPYIAIDRPGKWRKCFIFTQIHTLFPFQFTLAVCQHYSR